jgi:hypothetical protein
MTAIAAIIQRTSEIVPAISPKDISGYSCKNGIVYRQNEESQIEGGEGQSVSGTFYGT